jgi:hypothetical protein
VLIFASACILFSPRFIFLGLVFNLPIL